MCAPDAYVAATYRTTATAAREDPSFTRVAFAAAVAAFSFLGGTFAHSPLSDFVVSIVMASKAFRHLVTLGKGLEREGDVEPVRITSGRHPFEVVLLIAAPTVATVLVLTDTRPPAVSTAMTAPVRVVWVVLLIVSGITGLTGVLWPGRVEVSLSIEAVGVLILGSATSMYTVALLAVTGVAGAAAGGFAAAVAAGSWWRLSQIWRDLRKLDRAVRALNGTVIPAPAQPGDNHE